MNKATKSLHSSAILICACLAASLSPAATFYWSGASGTDQNWSTAGNWNPAGPPGTADTALFGVDATVGDATTINNVVNASTTISALNYTNSTADTWHVAEVPSGNVLTVSGNVTVGGIAANSVSTSVAMSGGGMFVATGSSFTIGNAGTANPVTPGTLNLSGLSNFVYSASGGTLGIAATGSRAMGTLTLAAGSNHITAATININGATGTGSSPLMQLGSGTNVINVNTFNVGGGRSTTTLQFADANGGWKLRGVGGTDADRSTMVVGNRNTGGTATKNTFGNVFLNGHPVDLKFATLTLGLMSRNAGGSDNGAYTPNGIFQFDQGTVDATTINMGVCSGNSSNSVPAGTLAVGAGGTLIAGSISLVNVSSPAVGVSGSGTLDIAGGIVNCLGNITKTTSIGTGTVNIASSGRLNLSGGARIGSLATPVDNLNMGDGTLQVVPGAGAPNAAVTTLTTSGSGNTIRIASMPGIASYPATFTVIKYTGTIGGSGYNFSLAGLPGNFTGSLVDNSANSSVDLVVTAGPVAQALTWNGNQSDDWDILTTKNWLAGGISTNYFDGDFVTFNDSASGNTTVELTTDVQPGSVTINNSTLPYGFAGSGKISGLTGLTKQGSGTLVVANSGVNDFGGDITIGAGTLQVGSGGTAGNLGAGAINNSANLVVNRSDALTLNNAISGPSASTLTKNGTGTLTLGGNNTFTGAVSVAEGTLRVANASALGRTNGSTMIAGGATLDFNAINVGLEPVIVSGAGVNNNGALFNSGAQVLPAVARVTLTGNTTFGGTGRWDLRSATTGDPSQSSLVTGGQPYSLIKTGANQVSIVGTTVDPALGDVDVQQGTLSVEVATTGLGNPANNLIVRSGATLQLFQLTNRLNKVITLNGNGTANTILNANGVGTIIGPTTLNGDCIVNVATAGTTPSLTLSNTIGGSGSLIKSGTGPLILAGGPDTYTGNTTVSNGTLLINCVVNGGGTLTVVSNATVGGTGTHTGPVAVGGVVAPGTSAGTLTTGPLTMNSGATFLFELSSVNTPGGGVNDLIEVTGDLTLNNNSIAIGLLAGSLQPGTYRLINYSGNLNGAFNPTVTVAGGASRFGLTLDTSTAHQVNLIVSGGIGSVRWDGSQGNAWDIATTSNWINTATSAIDAFFQGDNVLFNDAGLNTTVDIGAGITVQPSSITVDAENNSYTIAGNGRIIGATGITKSGASTLTLGSTNSHTGPLTVNGGAVRLTGINSAGSGLVTAKTGTAVIVGAAHTNSITLSNATLGAVTADFVMSPNSELTVQPSSTNVMQSADPQTPGSTSRNIQVDATLRGSGTILVRNADGVLNPDQQQGVRFRGLAASDYSGTIIVTNNSKSELRVNTAGPFSPVGTGKFILYAGAYDGGNLLTAPFENGYLEFNVRNNNPAGDTFIGNDFEFVGSGAVVMNALQDGGGAPAGAVATLGNLKMSGGQEMIGYKAAGGNVNALGFQSVTIAGGGNVIFSPKSPTFGPVGQTGADFVLGPISQLSPGSGIIMNGLRNLTLTGNNTYSGDTVINSGRLALTGSATINNSPNIAVATDAILDVTGRSDGKLTLVTGQTLSGNGTVYGSLQSGAGATISPGTSVGALTVTNAVILGGTNTMEIDKAAQTNDVIRGAASIQYGGTLNLVLLSDQFAQGDSFKLFYAGSYSGSFANIVPATPGADLGWDTSELTTTGTLKVGLPVSKPTIGTFTVTSGSVSLSGSGGLPNSTYSVLTSTNIALPLASWSVFTNGTFDGSGNFTISAPKPPGSPNFFRVQTP